MINNKNYQSLTLDYLRGKAEIAAPHRRKPAIEKIKIIGGRLNNLKNINVEIPLKKLIAITGVSGSGKSSLLEILYKNIVRLIYYINKPLENVSKILGAEYVKKSWKLPRARLAEHPAQTRLPTPAFSRPSGDFYASLEDSRMKGYGKNRFSFNVKGGRCEACEGAGQTLIEMHFLPPILVKCEVCKGKRFNRETLEIKYKNKNVADVLDLTVEEALGFFEDIYSISEKLKVLKEIGMGYVKLGQNATTLSGGEAQRIKLAKELSPNFNQDHLSFGRTHHGASLPRHQALNKNTAEISRPRQHGYCH